MKKFLSVLLSVLMMINFVGVRNSFATSESGAEKRMLEHSKQSEAKTEEEAQKHSEKNLQSVNAESDVAEKELNKKDKPKKEPLVLKSEFKWVAALLAGGFASEFKWVAALLAGGFAVVMSYMLAKRSNRTEFESLGKNKVPDFLPTLLECALNFRYSKSSGMNCLENFVNVVDLQTVYEFRNAISGKPLDY